MDPPGRDRRNGEAAVPAAGCGYAPLPLTLPRRKKLMSWKELMSWPAICSSSSSLSMATPPRLDAWRLWPVSALVIDPSIDLRRY
eukprot:569001-Pyramimonas_sp.AAC.1